MTKKVWLRLGDAGEYEPFDTPEEAASDIAVVFRTDRPLNIVRARHTGVEGIDIVGSAYEGENAVSLYWGDDDANLIAPLNHWELCNFARTFQRERLEAIDA